jgi:wobble nucleotide-excising tRNase
MIEKIPRLKKFGIFRDFTWSGTTPNFARFNLIYGWNKSGKTTFSRIFSACEKKTVGFKQYPHDAEFELKTGNHTAIKHSDCQHCSLAIKVFNKDFVDENVSFESSNSSNPIVYVSEEDIESSNKLKELRSKVAPLSEKYQTAQRDKQKSERVEDEFRKSTARTIKDIVGNLKVSDKYRDYDKGSIRATIESVGIDNFTKLSDSDFDKYKKVISGDEKQKQSLLTEYEISVSVSGKTISSFADIYDELKKLHDKKIVAETIDRLKDDPELNAWAQHGFELHKKKEEKVKCLFCQNTLDKDFLTSLSKHFSKDYENLQKGITAFIGGLSNLKRKEISEKNVDLYTDLQNDYKKEAKNINSVISKLNAWIDEATEKLNEKYSNPLSHVRTPKQPEDFKIAYDNAVISLNAIIKNHNFKVDNRGQEVKTAKETLEYHLIAVAIEQSNYKKIKEDYKEIIQVEKNVKNEMEKNNRTIAELEKETSNIGKAIQKINQHLEEFFGRKEIKLELDSSKKGYIIKRDGDTADNLSEGEKNAIAFSYFIVKAQERDFKIKEGVIVIDDPVSSFDSNFIYHCFSLIKNHFKTAAQLIISTHSFEFFNLIKDWFEDKNHKVESSNKKIAKEADKKPIPCEFFMIENIVENDKRCASIVPLDKTLRKFKSEYHFLFERLNQFINSTSPDYADFYMISNIARRFLEIYVNFKIPTTGDLKSKVDQLNTQTISEIEKDKIYRLIQEFSHGLDPVSTIEHKDKSEVQGAIKILMKMIEESDRKHFDSLKSSI